MHERTYHYRLHAVRQPNDCVCNADVDAKLAPELPQQRQLAERPQEEDSRESLLQTPCPGRRAQGALCAAHGKLRAVRSAVCNAGIADQ
jgi:hypothetical protein